MKAVAAEVVSEVCAVADMRIEVAASKAPVEVVII